MDYDGNWIHFPRPGEWDEQDEYELGAAYNSWAIEKIYGPGESKEMKKKNARFRYWVMSLSEEDELDIWLNPWLEDDDD